MVFQMSQALNMQRTREQQKQDQDRNNIQNQYERMMPHFPPLISVVACSLGGGMEYNIYEGGRMEGSGYLKKGMNVFFDILTRKYGIWQSLVFENVYPTVLTNEMFGRLRSELVNTWENSVQHSPFLLLW